MRTFAYELGERQPAWGRLVSWMRFPNPTWTTARFAVQFVISWADSVGTWQSEFEHERMDEGMQLMECSPGDQEKTLDPPSENDA